MGQLTGDGFNGLLLKEGAKALQALQPPTFMSH
ncbi:MAG: hypothetical protein QOF61_2761 [Acidobacteriota bacterium]|nr:hypothetical protein [Acidobacteriota bacterium]